MGMDRVTLTVIEGGPATAFEDVIAIVDDHVEPAVVGLRRAGDEHDTDALRAHALELIFLAGAILSTYRDSAR